MTYDEAMAIVSENVAVCNDAYTDRYYRMFQEKIEGYSKKYNSMEGIWQQIWKDEMASEWQIYEPATTACLFCLDTGKVMRKPDGILFMIGIGRPCEHQEIYMNELDNVPDYLPPFPAHKNSHLLDALRYLTTKPIAKNFYYQWLINKKYLQEKEEMTEEYNLTTEEAKILMKNGAVCEDSMNKGR